MYHETLCYEIILTYMQQSKLRHTFQCPFEQLFWQIINNERLRVTVGS